MTSLNAGVVGIRLVIALFIQRLIASMLGASGVAIIGQLQSLTQLMTSVTSFGIFNGIVKYVAEYKEDKEQLQKLFSTTFVFTSIVSVLSSICFLIFSAQISEYLFDSADFAYLIKIMAVVIPFISTQRIFNGVINGLSEYKKFAKIELITYLFSSALVVVFLFQFHLNGVLIAIAITPIIKLLVLLYIFFKILNEYVQFKKLKFKLFMSKELLAFTLMSFFSTVLSSFIEIDIRSMITDKITLDDAGIWTGMTNISKNYMVFSNSVLTLYVLPKFASIYNRTEFFKELLSIYKTLLPLFGIGMLFVYLFRDYVILIIYPEFYEMAPLFKWQLIGDFVRLASIVLSYQFVAKRMVKSFIFTELLSLGLFYGFAYFLTDIYGVEGVVMAHMFRIFIYIAVVFFLVRMYFNRQEKKVNL
ncbi:MAG TPA: O-antigen translocase [Flavobacteriaceae bacterium]|nr:O-antigen translocase [Flavobacteriaceae bacterium]